MRTPTIRMLERLGCAPTRVSRDPGNPFDLGTSYARCPRCRTFAAVYVDQDGSWGGNCSCWPRGRLDWIDLMVAIRGA